MNLQVTITVGNLAEDEVIIKELDDVELISLYIGNIALWVNTRDELDLIRQKIEEYLSIPLCELCNDGNLATQIASDELGNELHVCDDHAEQLAAKTPERRADEWFDQNHKSGD